MKTWFNHEEIAKAANAYLSFTLINGQIVKLFVTPSITVLLGPGKATRLVGASQDIQGSLLTALLMEVSRAILSCRDTRQLVIP